MKSLELRIDVLKFKIKCIKDTIKLDNDLLKNVMALKIRDDSPVGIGNTIAYRIHNNQAILRNYLDILQYLQKQLNLNKQE